MVSRRDVAVPVGGRKVLQLSASGKHFQLVKLPTDANSDVGDVALAGLRYRLDRGRTLRRLVGQVEGL